MTAAAVGLFGVRETRRIPCFSDVDAIGADRHDNVEQARTTEEGTEETIWALAGTIKSMDGPESDRKPHIGGKGRLWEGGIYRLDLEVSSHAGRILPLKLMSKIHKTTV